MSREVRQVWAYVVWVVAGVLLVVSLGVFGSGDCNDDAAPRWLLWGCVTVVALGWAAAFLHQWHRVWLALVLALTGIAVTGVAVVFTAAWAFATKCAA